MRLIILISTLALASTACEGDGAATIGPGSGTGTRVEALIVDGTASVQSLTGTLSGNVFASVGNATRWIDLGSPNGITVPLQSQATSTTVHGEQSVPSGTFTRVRLVLQGVTARITRGSLIGGVPLAADTTLTLGGNDAQAELTATVLPFTGEDSTTTKRVVIFDLRSETWLTPAAIQSGRVEDAALQAALIARTQSELR